MEESQKCFNEDEILLENCNIFVVNQYQENLNLNYLPIIKKTAESLLSVVNLEKSEKVELSIKIASDEDVHSLNKEYRNKDSVTNVLSFEYDLDEDELEEEFVYIGDIIFALPYTENQAKEQNKTLENHFAHLVAHSILHLLGFDHLNDEEREEMEALEIKILEKININNPYIIQED